MVTVRARRWTQRDRSRPALTGTIVGMTTTEPILVPPANGNPGIVPPWLEHPIGIYPMPEPPAEPAEDE